MEVIDSLRAKYDALAVKAERHANALNAVRAEMADIGTAIRVLEKHGAAPVSDISSRVAVLYVSEATSGPVQAVERPPALAHDALQHVNKTMPEMILKALESDTDGMGMIPQNVVSYIHRFCDPTADPNHIRPGLWRLHKRGRIGKTGDRYHLLDRPRTSPNLWQDFTPENTEAPM